MKEKCLTLIIGILIGAILASGGFMIYSKTHTSKTTPLDIQEKGQMHPMDRDGQKSDFTDGERPFNKKDKNSSTDQMPNNGEKLNEEPPKKSDDINTNVTSQS